MITKPNDVVSATEIASWSWCPEAWRLNTLGSAPGNETELARGESFHDRTARIEVSSRRTMAVGRRVLVCGLIVAAVVLALLKVVGR